MKRQTTNPTHIPTFQKLGTSKVVVKASESRRVFGFFQTAFSTWPQFCLINNDEVKTVVYT